LKDFIEKFQSLLFLVGRADALLKDRPVCPPAAHTLGKLMDRLTVGLYIILFIGNPQQEVIRRGAQIRILVRQRERQAKRQAFATLERRSLL